MLVSSIILQRDGSMTHNLDKYLKSFELISNLGIEIILFIDKKISYKFPKNVYPINISIEELESFKILTSDNRKVSQGLGNSYNPSKNTLDYMIIQNAKIELLFNSINMFNLDRVAWIDAGATHMLKCPEDTLKKLFLIDKLKDGIIIPGCWEKNDIMTDINWRFCGTFLNGDKQSIKELYKASCEALSQLKDIAIWEVNIWAWIELNRNFNFLWYKANHDDSLFDFDQYIE
jgi:hypothetical protein